MVRIRFPSPASPFGSEPRGLAAVADIFVIGDAAFAAVPNSEPLPGLAPVAKQQGRYVGELIALFENFRPLWARCTARTMEAKGRGRRSGAPPLDWPLAPAKGQLGEGGPL